MLYTEARKRMVAVLSVNDIKVKPEEINDILRYGFIPVHILDQIKNYLPEKFYDLASLYLRMGPPLHKMDLSKPIAPPPATKHHNPRGPKKKRTRKPASQQDNVKKNNFLPNIINRYTDSDGKINLATVRQLVKRTWTNYDAFYDPYRQTIFIANGNGTIMEEYKCPPNSIK